MNFWLKISSINTKDDLGINTRYKGNYSSAEIVNTVWSRRSWCVHKPVSWRLRPSSKSRIVTSTAILYWLNASRPNDSTWRKYRKCCSRSGKQWFIGVNGETNNVKYDFVYGVKKPVTADPDASSDILEDDAPVSFRWAFWIQKALNIFNHLPAYLIAMLNSHAEMLAKCFCCELVELTLSYLNQCFLLITLLDSMLLNSKITPIISDKQHSDIKMTYKMT